MRHVMKISEKWLAGKIGEHLVGSDLVRIGVERDGTDSFTLLGYDKYNTIIAQSGPITLGVGDQLQIHDVFCTLDYDDS